MVPTPERVKILLEIPTLYDPSQRDDVVDSPEIIRVSLFSNPCGLVEKATYTPLLPIGENSTPAMELVAKLTLVTGFPPILLTLAYAPFPSV